MKTNQKKKFRIGRVLSIIISAIMLYLSLQPLDDGGPFSRIIYLVPLSIAAWLFFLGRKNVFDYRETGETYEEDYDVVTEDLFGGKHLKTYTSTHNKSEGGFFEHSMKASWVFIPLCALDTFFCKVPGGIGFYWLIPVVLIILNILAMMPDKKSSKNNNNKTTELVVENVEDKSSNPKNIEVVMVEGARSQYYFDDVHSQYLFIHDIYKVEGNTATNKLYRITCGKGNKLGDSPAITDNDGNVAGFINEIPAIQNYREIFIGKRSKYKIIDNTSTVPCDKHTITDLDGNELAYYNDLQSRQCVYGPNDEPYVMWGDDKILSIMKDCPIDDKSVMLIIASILKSNIVKILGL